MVPYLKLLVDDFVYLLILYKYPYGLYNYDFIATISKGRSQKISLGEILRYLKRYAKIHLSAYRGVVIRPITVQTAWSYFVNFRVIGLIKVVPASKFGSDWSYKSQIPGLGANFS